jgi:hypothetical protein
MPLNRELPLDPSRVQSTMGALGPRALTHSEVIEVIRDHLAEWAAQDDASEPADGWTLPSPSPRAVLDLLIRRGLVRKQTLPFPHRAENAYVVGQVSLYDLLQSVGTEGYFTHFTALHLNQLTEQIPKTIYFNVEQRAKGGGGSLTQEAIDRAFKGKPRETSNVIEYKGTRICKLNGRNTDQLGVIPVQTEDAVGQLRVTNIERSLIDATVRPNYSGGVAVVAGAFEEAKDRLSVNKIKAYLKKLGYTYPYHQAVGFYLERAGVEQSRLALLRRLPMDFDFYLTYGMKSTDYDEGWRLFVPKRF